MGQEKLGRLSDLERLIVERTTPNPAKQALSPKEMLIIGASKLGSRREQMVEEDFPYLRQFVKPDQHVLEDQHLRPVNAPKMVKENVRWKRTTLPDKFMGSVRVWNSSSPTALPQILADPNTLTKDPRPASIVALANGLDGLGEHTTTAAKDNVGPYVSVLDKWDFSSPNIGKIKGFIMDKLMGKPFAVYDQFNIENYPMPDVLNKAKGELTTFSRRKK